jgi:hypothetical protein
MHIDWGRLWDYLYGNRLAIEGGLLFVITSGIKTSPVPISTFGKWMYDWGHQLFNITNTRLTTAPIVTPPSNKEESVDPKAPSH